MNVWRQRPRIGQQVQLFRDDKWYEVISLRRAKQVLEALSEEQAMESRTRMSANMGPDWVKYYYEADVLPVGAHSIPTLIVVNTTEIKDIRDSD